MRIVATAVAERPRVTWRIGVSTRRLAYQFFGTAAMTDDTTLPFDLPSAHRKKLIVALMAAISPLRDGAREDKAISVQLNPERVRSA